MTQRIPWLRVVVEGVVIVGSILLAFGIEAAWEQRGDRVEEARLLEGLIAEFRENQTRLVGVLAFHEDVEAAALAALEIAADPDMVVPSDSLDRLLIDLSWFEPARWVTGAIDALVTSGDLTLIENDSLRALLAAWPRSLQLASVNEEVERHTHLERWLPFLMERGYLPQVSNALLRRPGSDEVYETEPVPTLPNEFDHRAMFRDRAFHNLLLLVLWNQWDLRTDYARFASELDLLLATMEAELTGQ